MTTSQTSVILLGTGSVIPNPRRMATSQLLLTSNECILIDCGPGSSNRLSEVGYMPKNLSRILLTHLHADHCSELATIILTAFLQGRDTPLPIYGPVGTSEHVKLIFNKLYGYIPKLLESKNTGLDVPVFDLAAELVWEGEVKITCTRVIHGSIPALGYRINTSHGDVGFSGDTAPSDLLIELVNGVNLLVHECAYPYSKGPQLSHTIPSQLGLIAAKAEVNTLVMNHFFPECELYREEMIQSVARNYSGKIVFGEDLLHISIND